jgi:hypothetical protein
MRLLNNLAGISPSTYPKHPVDILVRLASKVGLAGVKFSVEKTELADARDQKFRGRARMRNIWLSSICYGSTRFTVRTKCAEEVLRQYRHDNGWLQQIQVDEDGKLVIQGVGEWAHAKLQQRIDHKKREHEEFVARRAAKSLQMARDVVKALPELILLFGCILKQGCQRPFVSLR